MTELERLQKAKIPCPETGIEIRHTVCDICTPGPQCGIDAFIKDGKVIKVEGTDGFPTNDGVLCTKGAASRQYIYREDRLKTPMKRAGARGEGKFEPISWEDAMAVCAEELNKVKANHGPEAVTFLCGYSKWFRPWLQRLAYSFGSPNYITESSTCHTAEVMSYTSLFGTYSMPDLRNAKMIMSWGSNGVINSYPMGRAVLAMKAQGGNLVVIDPRRTHLAVKYADLYLQPKIGSDAAIAHAMAKIMIEEERYDKAFVDKYCYGFEKYANYVSHFSLSRAEEISGVPAGDIRKALDMFLETDPSTVLPGNGLTHRINGYNIHRAILSLMALSGRYDRPGTMMPARKTLCESDAGFDSLEYDFYMSRWPQNARPRVGSERFPLWTKLLHDRQGQGMDLIRHMEEGTPYPLKAMVCFGVNDRMYLESPRFLAGLDRMDFVMATDIFHTDVINHADIVLPASTSFERSEVKCYMGQFLYYTRPAISPVHDNKDDVEIITLLANALDLDDDLLRSGYDKTVQHMLSTSGIEDWEAVKNSPLPVRAPNAKRYIPGTQLREGFKTPTGKIELSCSVLEEIGRPDLDPLPIHKSSDDDADPAKYPFVLMSGARIPNAVHSRTHNVPWLRSLRPNPSVDINPADAERLGIKQGDTVRIVSTVSSITVKANISSISNVGDVNMFHGYKEANINSIIPVDHLDPYTGFPGYKQLRCRIEKVEDRP
ncbi:MAG: molybdopterin-containing oxidoreductase family protein [Saccharofermentanales bacterium]|jgi:anaerobic selenocysteine-containing dehydrogenase